MPTLIEGTESCSGTSSPNAGNLATEAYAGALAGGYNSSGYDYFMVYFPYCSNIGWAGLADVGGTRTWINGHEMPAYVLSHELGHNFGAYHANWGSSGSPYSLMGSAPLPEGHFNVAGKEVFDWVPHDAIVHVASPDHASLCDDGATCVTEGTFTLSASDAGDLANGALAALKIYTADTSLANTYYYVEYRSLYEELAGGAYINWAAVWMSSGPTGTYATQLVDAHSRTDGGGADLDDAALNVGETMVLELDSLGAVLRVDAVDAAAKTLTISVWFVEPSSAYQEAMFGIDGSLNVGCDGGDDGGEDDGDAVIVQLAGDRNTTLLRLDGILDPSMVSVQVNCTAGYDAVRVNLFPEYPLGHMAYGAPLDIGPLASLEVDCTGSPPSGTLSDVELTYHERDGVVYDPFSSGAYLVIETATSFDDGAGDDAADDAADDPAVAGSCPETCFGDSCVEWVDRGYSCADMEGMYNCDCEGCDMSACAPTAVPTNAPTISVAPTWSLAPTRTRVTEVALGATCAVFEDNTFCGDNRYSSCGDSAGDASAEHSWFGVGCNTFNTDPSWCGYYDDTDFSSRDMCCGCGGGTWSACADCPDGQVSPAGSTSVEACVDPNCGTNECVLVCRVWLDGLSSLLDFSSPLYSRDVCYDARPPRSSVMASFRSSGGK